MSMNVDDIPMGEYCRYVTFMTEFVINVNIAVFYGIRQKNIRISSWYILLIEYSNYPRLCEIHLSI